MRVVISAGHLSLNKRLIEEINSSTTRFDIKNYLRIENIDPLLAIRGISVLKKKRILLKKLHSGLVSTFSIPRKVLNKRLMDPLRRRLQNIRKIINKLRSINYYLESAFLDDLRKPKSKIITSKQRLLSSTLAKGELEELEYAVYRLIAEAVVLDKKLLDEYSKKERTILIKEKISLGNLEKILGKDSTLLEHLEAKLPPPKMLNAKMLNEPVFTHWVARIFALLSYLEYVCVNEDKAYMQFKKNKYLKSKINKKITQILKERAKLLNIMHEKLTPVKTDKISQEIKKEFHHYTTAVNL